MQIVLSQPVLERVVHEFPDLDARLDYDSSSTRRSVQAAVQWPANQLRDRWRRLLVWSGLSSPTTPATRAAVARARGLDRLQPRNNIVLGPSGTIVQPVDDADVINIGLVAGNPDYACRVVDAVVGAYLDHRLSLDRSKGPADFYRDQVASVQTQLAAARQRLSQFQESEGVVSYQKQESLLLDQVAALTTAQLDLRRSIIDQQTELAAIHRAVADHPDRPVPTLDIDQRPEIQRLTARLVDLQLERTKALEQFVPGAPRVVEVESQIAETRTRLASQVQAIVDLKTRALETDQAKAKALETEMASLRAQLDAYPRKARVVTSIASDIDDQQKLLSMLVQKLGEEQVAAAVDRRVENVKVLRPAAYSITPQSPSLSLSLLLGLALGFGAGLGLALLGEALDHSIRNERDVERYLNLPTLTSIGTFPSRALRIRVQKR